MSVQPNPTPQEYDDDACLAFIRKETKQIATIAALSDDDLLYIVDLIYDYMESRGYLDDEADEEFDIDLDEIYEYVIKNIKRDEMSITLSADDLAAIFDAEDAYTESLL